MLLKFVINRARENKIEVVHFLGDMRKGFPKDWYHKMGFGEDGWVEYEVLLDKLKI
jgi:hypothetical protein